MDIAGKPVLFFFLKGNRGGGDELILGKEVGKRLGGMEGGETGQDVMYERLKVFKEAIFAFMLHVIICLSISVYSLSNKHICICRDWN